MLFKYSTQPCFLYPCCPWVLDYSRAWRWVPLWYSNAQPCGSFSLAVGEGGRTHTDASLYICTVTVLTLMCFHQEAINPKWKHLSIYFPQYIDYNIRCSQWNIFYESLESKPFTCTAGRCLLILIRQKQNLFFCFLEHLEVNLSAQMKTLESTQHKAPLSAYN